MAKTVRRTGRRVPLLGALLVLLLVGIIWHQQITDWVRLQGYTPSDQVSALAANDGFTPKAEHLFYINRPEIVAKNSFVSHCKSADEQTIVLGCYHGVQNGIYVLKIASDSRLDGVMQVTAAHEMLHAGYDRMSSSQRKQVDGWLQDYYEHGLTDERVKKTIEAYKKSEPDAVQSEMHSVFGTEVADLPTPLELYYKQYFTDRKAVVARASGYQEEFTSREKQVAAYDTQLASLKKQIANNEQDLKNQSESLKSQTTQMEWLKARGGVDEYNAQVSSYNKAAAQYNLLVQQTKNLIAEYNQMVATRNSIALEQRQLTKELSGDSLSTVQ